MIIQDLNIFYDNHISSEEKQRFSALEPFDEFEDWHLKCSHYVMITAGLGNCSELVQTFRTPMVSSHTVLASSHIYMEDFSLDDEHSHVYGHTISELSDNLFLLIGGFGERNGRHQRICDVCVFDAKIKVFSECELVCHDLDNKCMSRLFHSATSLRNGKYFLRLFKFTEDFNLQNC